MKYSKLLAAILGGCLGFLSFPEINWTVLVAIAYVPYLWLLNRCESIKQTIWYTWLFAAVMTLGGFFWVAYTAVAFGGLPEIAAVAILLLYTAVGSINLVVAAGVVAIMRKHLTMKWQAIWVTAVFVIVEAIFPKLFYWYVGNAIYQVIPLIQIADLGGPILLTTQIFLVNYALFTAFDHFLQPHLARSRSSKRTFTAGEAQITIALAAVFLAFSLIYGHFRLRQVEGYAARAVHKTIGIVQGNLGNYERLQAQFGDGATIMKFVEVHRDLTLKLFAQETKKIDLVVWPEGAYPYPFPEFYSAHRQLAKLTRETGAALVTGGVAQQREPVYQAFNAMILLEPGRTTASAIYKKHILLAFGEYMPFSDLWPALKNFIPAVSDFTAGPGAEIMRYEEIRAAPLICYEALYPNYVRQYALQNANIIFNVTNDSWYGEYQEPEQHLALSQLRCVESRKVQIRSTNTGISAVIWPSGKITHRTRLNQATAFSATVPLMEMPPTLYARFGDWWAGVMAIVVLVMMILKWYSRPRLPVNSL